jgi:hypothetical protein
MPILPDDDDPLVILVRPRPDDDDVQVISSNEGDEVQLTDDESVSSADVRLLDELEEQQNTADAVCGS